MLIKNIPPQIDASMLRSLCMQNGNVVGFVTLPGGQALVRFHTKEEASKAYKDIQDRAGGSSLVTDFISDRDVAAMSQSQSQAANMSSSLWPQSQQSAGVGGGSSSSFRPEQYMNTEDRKSVV